MHLLLIIYSFFINREINEKIISKYEKREQMTYIKGRRNVKTEIDNKRKTIEEYSRVGPAKRVLRLHEGGKGCYFHTS